MSDEVKIFMTEDGDFLLYKGQMSEKEKDEDGMDKFPSDSCNRNIG